MLRFIVHIDEIADFSVWPMFRSVDDDTDWNMRVALMQALYDGKRRVCRIMNPENNLEIRIILLKDALQSLFQQRFVTMEGFKNRDRGPAPVRQADSLVLPALPVTETRKEHCACQGLYVAGY
ncbi:hypothetical protein Gbth_008_069 [Gluconobacter thailandicus F149-1 = NBRC 100600]|nr:hypothetical protein Gbth_008_069 [Gluconobacter thailandicus F149-1 = NBRC 100600]GBR58403.1 hypothetical protein AA100600_0780 [Gluconobacter thailandicus F149-1 = NBRC 100600]GEL87248.1 hypothetical protein GTH01_16060 [Gluconobacter thailandicus F149-1 = NBRC 100600]